MLTTVNMLRRMNSEISTISVNSITSTDNDNESSPALSHQLSTFRNVAEIEERGRSRGSQHYLSLGQASQAAARNRRKYHAPEKRDSHRIHKERRKKRNEEASDNNLIDELTPVKENSSPTTGTNALGIIGLQFPKLSHEGSVRATPERQRREMMLRSIDMDSNEEFGNGSREEKDQRWSDAMSKPVKNAVRRESQMEHPAPVSVTPPKWTLSGLGLAGARLLDRDAGLRIGSGGDGENGIGGEAKRPDSLGLYDQEGFLKSSPDRERILSLMVLEERKDGTPKERISEIVM